MARDTTLVPADTPIEILKRVRYDGHLGTEPLTQVAINITIFSAGPWRLVVAGRIGTGAPGIALIANGPRLFPGRPDGSGASTDDVVADLAIYHGPTDRDGPWPRIHNGDPPAVLHIPLPT